MSIDKKNVSTVEPRRWAEDLMENACVDTVYGDLYLQRARHFLESSLSEAEFATLQHLKTESSNLPNHIMVAMKQANWVEVKELSNRMATLKRALAEDESLLRVGEKIYQPGLPSLDPFSPGLQGLAGGDDPRALLNQLSAKLERLQTADPDWRSFYAARRSAMAAINVHASKAPEEADLSGSQLEQKALEALDRGDFANLEKLAARMEKEEPGGTEKTPGSSHFAGKVADLAFQFPREVVNRAQSLGLSPMRMEVDSRMLLNLSQEDLAPLYRYLWHPTFTDEISPQGPGLPKKEITLPAGTPSAFRDLIEQFALHPFINSGGARFVPFLTEEDVLVEDFDEPVPGSAFPASALLSALGLEDHRCGLSRIRLEKVLLDRGNAIIRDIGLDPFRFRLICIPPDVYGRVGHGKGWGRQQLWTHFDGYMVMQNGTLSALAGGDVRFGGLFDLVGVSREYDSDRIIARFAVVQRRRMEAVQ